MASSNQQHRSAVNGGVSTTREDILKLMSARCEVDDQIRALGGILESVKTTFK